MEYGSPEQLAHHEAGHAVAAFAVHGINVTSVSLEPMPDEGSAARCTYDQRPPSPLGDLLVTMAGPGVDTVTVGEGFEFEPGARSDLRNFHDIMEERMGIDCDRPMDASYCETVERADRVLRRFVERNFILIQKVASALLERRTLTGDDLRALLPAELENSLYAPKARPQRKDPRQGELFGGKRW